MDQQENILQNTFEDYVVLTLKVCYFPKRLKTSSLWLHLEQLTYILNEKKITEEGWYLLNKTYNCINTYNSTEEYRNAIGIQIASAVISSLTSAQGGTKQ